MKTRNLLEGSWKIVETQIYSNRWERQQALENRGFVMEFQPTEHIDAEYRVRFKGIFVDHDAFSEERVSSYCFDPSSMTLDIYHNSDESDCVSYGVEVVGDNLGLKETVYLSVQNDPDFQPPYYRLVISRIS